MAKDLSKSKSWVRPHGNGMDALVFDFPSEDEQYAAGAIPRGGVGALGHVRGPLTKAQIYADDSSGCRQPCSCPPWSE